MSSFLFEATVFLGAAVVAVPIAARLGLGSVLGYLIAGLALAPFLGMGAAETEDLRHFAEFGVVMMLFIIGLELDPRALWDMRHRLMGLGGLQLVLTTGLLTYAGIKLGLDWQTATAVGMALTLSSTAIVLQTLTEKNLMQTAGGRSAFSVLLSQDIAVIPMLALLPLLSTRSAHGGDDHGAEALSLVEGLPGWGVTLVTLGAVVAVILAGRFLVRPIIQFIDSARLREMYTAFALLIVVGIAVLMTSVGLSPALGTFLAGVVLANSEFRHQLESDVEPFKGLLLGLFFITVGAGLDVTGFLADPFRLFGLALALMAIKGAVLAPVGFLFKLRGRDLWLFTLGLAQAGEFGFVLAGFSLQQGAIDSAVNRDLLTVIALSMLLTPLFFIAFDLITKKRRESHTTELDADEIDEQHHIIIVGIGRFGQVVNRLIRSTGLKTTVLDSNLQTIQTMRKFGVQSFFGDPTRPDLLHAAGLATAKVLVVAVNSPASTTRIVAHARKIRPDIHIVARAHDRAHVYELYQAGANDIVREMFDSSLRAGRYVLENMGLSEFEANEAETTFFRQDRKAIRELANYWEPGVPVSENEAYVKRAIELERDMEEVMLTMQPGGDAPTLKNEDSEDL